ncbi:MAG: hypothetical protein M0P26_08285 [Bacteroidales bacterium]|nr:hypothetical protein [Bacteroidales bacterium]
METYLKRINLSQLLPFAFCLLVSLSSCVNEPNLSLKNHDVYEFADIITNPTFNWNATLLATLEVTGLETPNVTKKTLRVTSLDGSEVFFSKLQTLSENLSIPILLPTSVTRVKVVYGVIVKEVFIENKTIKFDYLTVTE